MQFLPEKVYSSSHNGTLQCNVCMPINIYVLSILGKFFATDCI
jgi:hypothetical protein